MAQFVPPRQLWEATTAVLEVGHDPDGVMQRGLRALCDLLTADRADAGRVDVAQVHYRPDWMVAASAAPASPRFALPLDDTALRRVLAEPRTMFVVDAPEQLAGTPTGDLMTALDTRAMVVRRLERHGDGAGVVCVDWVGRVPEMPADALGLADEYIAKVLSPVLERADATRRRTYDPLDALTAAERAVCRLAADGGTYRDIAAARGTSVNTVGHQLSAARSKLGVPNTAALCRLVALHDRLR